jgi:hypothetical protein
VLIASAVLCSLLCHGEVGWSWATEPSPEEEAKLEGNIATLDQRGQAVVEVRGSRLDAVALCRMPQSVPPESGTDGAGEARSCRRGYSVKTGSRGRKCS